MKVVIGIASSTHIDRHNDRMAKSGLESMAKAINSKYIPHLIEHDFDRQIGVVLYGEIKPMEEGEFALYIVSGIFENEQEKLDYPNGAPNVVWGKYAPYLKDVEPIIAGKITQDPLRVNSSNKLTDLLERHLDSTKVLNDGRVYIIKYFIASVGDLQIHVYPKDHAPKHFHIISKQKNIDARFDIETLELISTKRGKIKISDVKKIQHFFLTRPDMLERLKREHLRMNS